MKGREHRPDVYVLLMISIYDFDSFCRIVHNLQVMREARVDQSSETQILLQEYFNQVVESCGLPKVIFLIYFSHDRETIIVLAVLKSDHVAIFL
jgi:hypothetical protein